MTIARGIWVGGGDSYENRGGNGGDVRLELNHTTISGNAAKHKGGGAFIFAGEAYDPGVGSVKARNSIIANNTAESGPAFEVTNGTVNASYSLVEGSSSPAITSGVNGNITGKDPGLGPLQDNGGPTKTHAITRDSPAFNAGDPEFSSPPTYAQRGAPRVSGGRVDMGAYELQVDPILGLLYDRSRDGHGLDFQRVGDIYFFTFYTYDKNGRPEWYQAIGELNGDTFTGKLYRYAYDATDSPPQTGIRVGRADIQFNVSPEVAGCDDGVDRSNALQLSQFHWRINGQSGRWCLELLVVGGTGPVPNTSGTWYAGEMDTGWGLTLSQQDTVLVAILYYYDAEGNPRWALGSTQNFQNGDPLEMLEFTGYCRDCGFFRESEAAGSIRLTLDTPSQIFDGNSATIDVEYLGREGGTWMRNDVPIKLISDPLP